MEHKETYGIGLVVAWAGIWKVVLEKFKFTPPSHRIYTYLSLERETKKFIPWYILILMKRWLLFSRFSTSSLFTYGVFDVGVDYGHGSKSLWLLQIMAHSEACNYHMQLDNIFIPSGFEKLYLFWCFCCYPFIDRVLTPISNILLYWDHI